MRRLRHVLPFLLLAASVGAASAESGYQTIQGTRVFTEIDHEAGVATFSNDCGTQKLTQSELQGGAIPTDIIPCPRDGGAGGGSDEGASEADQDFREGLRQKNLGKFDDAQKAFWKAGEEFGRRADDTRDKIERAHLVRQADVAICLSSFAARMAMYADGAGPYDEPTAAAMGCQPDASDSSLVHEMETTLAALISRRTAEEAAAKAERERPQEAPQAAPAEPPPSDERCAIGIGTTKRVTCVSPGEDCECLSFGNTCPYPVTITYQVDNFPTRSFELEGGKTDNGSACSTRSGQRVSYVRFRPWAGYPKPGQPQAEEKIEAGAQPEKAAVPKFAAYAANSEFGGGLGHGATEQEAVDEALRICRSNGSNTCVKRPTVTGDMSKVFATACCRVPRLGCVTAVGVSATDAALAAKDILKRAKFTECETSNSIRAGVR